MKSRFREKRLLLLGIMLFGLSVATWAQKVSLNCENVELQEALLSLKKQTGYGLVFSDDVVNVHQKVSIQMEKKELADVLTQLLKDKDVTFEIKNKKIYLISRQKKSAGSDTPKKLSGIIVDKNGEPVIGASIIVQGTTNGTITDFDGNYTLQDVPADATISISYIGYQTLNIKASAKDLAKIVMKEDSEMLEEVVVVGYGSQKRANLTGAVATISAEDINSRPVATTASALQGADPSVNLTFNSGVMDSDYSIDIRGVASINGGTPLVLADGMEVSLNQINPNDIESISILKDASASAIYGAKASSGVILITTKSGKNNTGNPQISYNGRFAWHQNTTSTDFITTGYDHVTIVNEFYEIMQGRPMMKYSDDDLQMLYDRRNDKTEHPDRPWTIVGDDGTYYYYANFDWYNYFFRTTRPEQEHNVSVTGGNEKINYFVSGRYLTKDGIFNIYHDKYKNYSLRAKLNAQLNSNLRYSLNMNFNNNSYDYAGDYDEAYTFRALQSNINAAFMPINPDGSTVQYMSQLQANSPLGAGHGGLLTANTSRNNRSDTYWVMSNQIDYTIFKDLTLTASYAYKERKKLTKRRNLPFEYSRKEGQFKTFTSGSIYDSYQEIHQNARDHNVNLYGTYQHTWDEKHNFKAVTGMQYEDYRTTNLSVMRKDLLSDKLSSMGVAVGETTVTQSISAYRTLGFFGRLNYDYEGKYLAEISGRWDGSSRFSAADRWGFFPSASFGWRMSQEPFWESIKEVMPNAKFRFSMGSLGNQQVSNYAYIDKIYADNTMNYTFDGLGKAYYASVSAPISSSLTWETVTTYNWGLDMSFLNNRLNVNADVFIRDTKDMLTTSLTLPSVYGASTPKANCANLRTRGWELYVGWNDRFQLAGKPFNYTISATLGDYVSEITKFNNPDKLISDYYEGMTLGEIWGYQVEGLFASDEEAAAYQKEYDDTAVNGRVYKCKSDNFLRAGDVKFKDLDGDKVISEGSGTVADSGDKRIIGNSLPRYSYTFRLGADWNGIDISAFFQGVGKRDWWPTAYAYDFWGPYSFPSVSFIHKDFMDKTWSEENPDAYFPRHRGYASYSGGALGVENDRYLQNAAYLRLKNLTIGYTLPISKRILDSVRIYASGENLFYWSPLKNHTKTVDPEMAVADTYDSGSGVGYAFSKSFSIGIDITF